MKLVTRRDALKLAATAGAVAACSSPRAEPTAQAANPVTSTTTEAPAQPEASAATKQADADPVLDSAALGFQWKTQDPFLFCVHHDDRYPVGNPQMGPVDSLAGRKLGSDFQPKDGWRMYHGRVVPGFPRHPHRGFETVTVVRTGLLDHSDSIGGTARYGGGDVQWLTAGDGIQHAEMFPLLKQDGPNPLELFQIWLNLPQKSKRVPPHFAMLWNDQIPTQVVKDTQGKTTEVTVIAGQYTNTTAPPPPPNSWASDADGQVAIWTVKMQPGARWTLPAAPAGVNRTLYNFLGEGVSAGGRPLAASHQFDLRPETELALENGAAETEMLLLQGRPIGEPVARHGPFVMNTAEEIRQAYADYRSTQFGGWPWTGDDPVHGREQGRFAIHPDGRKERPA